MSGANQERRRDGGRAGEGRPYLTVLFADLSGSTRLGHVSDPEILEELLQHIKDAAFEAIARHHGTVVQFHGDGVLAIFGYPTHHEDDVRRATEAALDLHEAVRALELRHLVPSGFEIRMHSGIDSGLVVVRDGDEVFGRYKIVGQPANSAAALADRARSDEILVTRHTMLGSLPYFDVEEVPAVSLKGVDEPLDVYRVLRRTEVRTRFEASIRSGLTPFIGREDVLDKLERSMAKARMGRLARVRVVGDAGLGKTRTLEEFLARAREAGSRVLTGFCEQEGELAPLLPFQQIVREALGLGADPSHAPDPAPLTDRLESLDLLPHATEILGLLGVSPRVGDGAGGGEGEGHSEAKPQGGAKGLAALAALLHALSRQTPLVLFIDDWQWSDDASRLVAGELPALVRDAAILWLIATRPTGTTDSTGENETRIELGPFRPIESANALEALSPKGFDLGLAEKLHQRSGGNPLFLEELFRSVGPNPIDDTSTADVPPTLHGLIQGRVHALPEDHATVLRSAAVIGNVVPTWLLDEVTSIAEHPQLLDDLEAQDLLHPGAAPGTLRFKHGITREVVYHSVRLTERRSIHADIAQHLERRYADRDRDKPLETLAHHYEGAANFERAAHFAEAAGDRAWASSALDRARLQYGAALRALDRLEESQENLIRWLGIAQRRAFACVFSPASEQIEMLNRAAEIGVQLGNPSAVGHAHFWSGFISYSLGNLDESIASYSKGMAAAREANDEKLVAQLRANLGQSQAAACDYHAAMKTLDASLDAKRKLHTARPNARVPTGFAYGIAVKAFVAAERGEAEEAEHLFEEALEIVEDTGHPVAGSCLAFQSTGHLLLGHLDRVGRLAPRVQANGERMNGPFIFGRGRADGSFSRFMRTGDLDALTQLQAISDWLEEKEIRLYISISFGCTAEAMARAGRWPEARRYAERGLGRASLLDSIGEGMSCRALARVMARDAPNEPERADALLDRSIAAARLRGSARELALTRATRAQLLVDRGEHHEARDELGQTMPELARMGLDWYHSEARQLAESLGGL